MTRPGVLPRERCPRSWLGLTSLALTIAVVVQQFGRIVPLTRTDRIMDPARFIGQNFELWNPYADTGVVPFSSIGFLFVFDLPLYVGQTIGLPTWLVLRLMVAAVIVVGLWGFVRLMDEWAIATPMIRLLGGVAYALTPMILSRAGWRIGEAIAPAMLPWLLLPLVIGARRGSPRRAAALSGLALAAVGGTNAAVALALLPLPALFLLTRARGPRRALLIRWWVLAVPLAVLWWMPLLVFLALYGGQLLRYSEQIGDTTSAATLFNVLRGTADWIVGLTSDDYVTAPRAISLAVLPALAVVIVAAAGLAGLTRRDLPERRFLVLSAILGAALISATQAGILANPLSDLAIAIFEGPLEPFRNVYKLQSIITLPVIVGATHAAGLVARRLHRWEVSRRRVAFAFGALVVLVTAAPIWSQDLFVRGSFEEVPSAWSDVERLLEADDAHRVVVLPGLRDAVYDWGRTSQLPLEWMDGVEWATRNQLPLNDQAATQYLDAVELAVERGGDAGLADFLLRGGYSHIVVPNDGVTAPSAAPSPTRVASALASSGLAAPVGFGPVVDEESGRRQIEVYRLGETAYATSIDHDAVTVLLGDAETVLQVPVDVFGERAFVLGDDPIPDGLTAAEMLVSDGNRRAAVYFGENRNNRGYTLGPLETEVNGQLIDDLLYRPAPESEQTVRVIDGVRRIDASSVGPGPLQVGRSVADPSNVIDGDADTAWQPNRLSFQSSTMWAAEDPWVEITFTEPRSLEGLGIELFVADVDEPHDPRITVTTQTGTVTTTIESSEDEQPLEVPAGTTTTVRVSVERRALAAASSSGSVLGIAELRLPGFDPVRRLRLPVAAAEPTDAEVIGWVLTRLRPSVEGATRLSGEAEIARVVPVATATDARVWVRASASRRSDLITELGETGGVTVTADSTFLDRPGLSPRGLVDRSPLTRWVSAESNRFEDAASTVTLSWDGDRSIEEFRLGLNESLARPSRIAVSDGRQVRIVTVGDSGWVRFAPLTTDTLTIRLEYDVAEEDEPTTIGSTGLEIPALDDLLVTALDLDETVEISCDAGPSVLVGGVRLRYSLTTTWNEIFQSGDLPVEPCDGTDVELAAGEVTVDGSGGHLGVSFDQIVLDSRDPDTAEYATALAAESPVEVLSWGPTRRSVRLDPADTRVLLVNESHNRGWTARLGDEELPAVRVDGWRQGFVVPDGGAGVVELSFRPAGTYRTSVIVGLVLLAGLVALALVPGRSTAAAPVGAGVVSRALVRAVAVGAAVWCTGVLAVFLPLLWWLDRRRPHAATAVAGGGLFLAGCVHLVVLDPSSGASRWYEAGTPMVTVLTGLAFLGLLAASVRSDTPAVAVPPSVADPASSGVPVDP